LLHENGPCCEIDDRWYNRRGIKGKKGDKKWKRGNIRKEGREITRMRKHTEEDGADR
jgi:hypothetical protein